MRVRLLYGSDNGREKDFPYHVGLALVEAGRGERVDGVAPAAPAVATATPPHQQRDPKVEPPKPRRFGRRG